MKDNGWLRIIDEFLLKETPEEFWRGINYRRGDKDWEKTIREETEAGIIYRTVLVKIEFLKPCKATSLEYEWDDINNKLKIKGDFGTSLEYEDPFDGRTSKFRCDYRLKVFATFYSKNGVETGTYDALPSPQFIDGVKKDFKVPGERMWMNFVMPENAVSWKIWVPK